MIRDIELAGGGPAKEWSSGWAYAAFSAAAISVECSPDGGTWYKALLSDGVTPAASDGPEIKVVMIPQGWQVRAIGAGSVTLYPASAPTFADQAIRPG